MNETSYLCNHTYKLSEMLEHTTGLRQHGLTGRLVLVVLGSVEGADCAFPSLSPRGDYHTFEALIYFQRPLYVHVAHNVCIPES